MSLRLHAKPATSAGQQGYALLLTMIAMIMATLTFLVQAATNSRPDRDEITRRALMEAKQALIGFAATASQGPGHLVCPDDPSDDADASMIGVSPGATCSQSVGRLPWKTLELPDLRDSSGERLWYALSPNFINKTGNPVNSDTKGLITVNGLAANEVIAVVFAPGPSLAGQGRNTDADLQNIQNYLEGANSDGTANIFEALPASNAFNDRMLIIRAADLFPIVENAVASRIESDIAPLLRYYRDQWDALGTAGFFPFARAFANDAHLQNGPSTGECGTATVVQGVLPPTVDCVKWETDADSVVTLDGNPVDCSIVSGGIAIRALQCNFSYTGEPELGIETGVIEKAAAALVSLEHQIDRPWTPTTLNTVMNSQGDVAVTYKGKLPDAGTTAQTVNLTLSLFPVLERVEELGGASGQWFFQNGWYRQTWYAISASRAPLGTGPCVSANCLSVVGGNNNEEALLILGAQTLPAATQPVTRTGLLAEYFEDQNVIDASLLEFKSAKRSSTFNDKLVVVAP